MKRKEEKKILEKREKGNGEGLFKRIPCGRVAEGQHLPLEHVTLRLTFNHRHSQQK